MSDQELLALTFSSGDLNKSVSIREFMQELLLTLWDEQEGFSGKRPFGNSGWTGDMEACLIKAGVVTGELDDDGCIYLFDNKEFDKTIVRIIRAL